MSHILIACHAWYGDVIGGSFRLASEFAEDLAASGHAVDYLCCMPPGDGRYLQREEHRGVLVHRYPPPPPTTSRWGRMRWHVRESARLVREIANEHTVDALSGHSPLQFLGAASGSLKSGAFRSYVVHSPFDDELATQSATRSQSIFASLAFRAARWVDRRCIRLADEVQTDSQYTLDVLRSRHRRALQSKGVVAPGWVDAGTFTPVFDRRELRSQLGPEWTADGPVFFTLRRLEPRMGLDTLVAAAVRLRKSGEKFRVLIGGSGSLREELESQVAEHGLGDAVRFLGRIPEADLPRCYAAADCFVLPTRSLECFGLIVLEAFAAGTPVIASDAAAIPELAAIQGREWLFPAGDAAALADRMQDFLAGRLPLDVNVRSFAERYDRPLITAHWESLLSMDACCERTPPTAVAGSGSA
ncbi:MAG: glycosyltransferase family 4 protein [Planctomycetaceae bacterium]